MSFLDSFFSPKSTTTGSTTGQTNSQQNTNQTTNQSSTQSTQNNLWPQLSDIFQQYQNSFTPAPFNAYQTNAANRQDVVGGNLNPGFSAAGNIASGGLSPTAYTAYMSPFISSVVNPTVQAYDLTNRQALSNIDGNLAAKGALGNSNNAATKALYYQAVLPQQQAQIGNIYNQGYNQAVDTALKSQGQQLQGASTLAGLTGAATGANTAGFNIGQTLWQDPLSWQTQWAGALSPFLQGAGQTSTGSSTGSTTGSTTGSSTSSGTSNQTKVDTPSPFQQLAGIAGTAASLFTGMPSFGGGGGWVNPDTGGSFNPSSGLYNSFADGGAIKGYDEGGAVVPGAQPSFHEADMPTKLKMAFEAFNGMAKASGGEVKPYAGGGEIKGYATDGFVSDLTDDSMGGGGDTYGPRTVVGGEAAPMPVTAPGITPAPRPYAPYQRQPIAPPVQQPSYAATAPSQPASNWGPLVSGRWDSGTGPMARALFAASGPLIGKGIADQAGEMVKEQQARRNAEDLHKRSLAQMMGTLDGRPTLERERMTAAQAQHAADQAERTRQWNAQFGENRRMNDAQLTRMDPGWGITKSVEARKKLAPQFGLKEGTDEYLDFVGTGKMPIKKTQAQVDWDKRYDAAVQYGGKAWADSEEGRNWILNYKPEKPSRVDTAFDTKIAEMSAKDYEKRVEAARDAQSKLQTIDQLDSIVSNPNVYQGKGAAYVNEFKRLGSALGFPVEGVAETELLNSLGNQMALKLRSTAGGEGMPGALSDSDRRFLSASVPGATNTRQGNQAMLYMMRKSENYKVQANSVAMDYIAAKGSNVGLAQYMTEWMRQHPMLSPDDKRKINTLSGGKFSDLVPPDPPASGVAAPGTVVVPSPNAGPRPDPMGLRQ